MEGRCQGRPFHGKEISGVTGEVNNYDNIRAFLHGLVEQASAKAQAREQGKLDRDIVIQYVNAHYFEDLYLDKMAEIFNTTPKYFSNFFKKNSGVNFVEYVNKIRILPAKEFLKNTEMPVNGVSEKVDFVNSSTFINAFKKYCGISPTEYRKEVK